jgi:hypothetical protein
MKRMYHVDLSHQFIVVEVTLYFWLRKIVVPKNFNLRRG